MGSITHKIEKLLESKKLSKTRFAELLGVNRDTVYNLTDESIKLSTIIKISEIFDVPIGHFLTDKDVKNGKIVSEPDAIYNKRKSIIIDLRGKKGLNIDLQNQKLTIND